MQLKSIAILLFSTVAFAQEGVEKRADESSLNIAAITSFPSEISFPSLPTNSIPPSVLSVLETAVPSSVLDGLATDSAYRSSYISAIKAGSTPAWYSSLPPDVKAYVSTAVINTAAATATGASASASATAAATGSSSANAALAPAPTGFIAGSVAGIAGVLALAFAL